MIGTVFAGQFVLVRRWRADDGKMLNTLQMPVNVHNVSLSRDGSRYVFTIYDPSQRQDTLRTFEIMGNAIRSITLNISDYALAFSDDGSGLLTRETSYTTGTQTETIRVRSRASGAVLRTPALVTAVYDSLGDSACAVA